MNIKALKFIISFIIMFFIVVFYGCFIGGNIGIIQFSAITIISFLLIVFSLGRTFKEKSIIALLSISIIVSTCFSGIYYCINNVFDNKKPIAQYQIQISDLPEGKNIDDGFYYFDENGDEIYYSEFRFIPFDFEIGDLVDVEEFEGAFKVKHYKFSKN